MSWVTTILLNVGIGEEADERMAEVNRFFEAMPHVVTEETEEESPLASIEPVWDGKGHGLGSNLYVGAYNYFPLEKFVAHLKSVTWEEPEYLQLFVQDEEEGAFRLYKLDEDGAKITP